MIINNGIYFLVFVDFVKEKKEIEGINENIGVFFSTSLQENSGKEMSRIGFLLLPSKIAATDLKMLSKIKSKNALGKYSEVTPLIVASSSKNLNANYNNDDETQNNESTKDGVFPPLKFWPAKLIAAILFNFKFQIITM